MERIFKTLAIAVAAGAVIAATPPMLCGTVYTFTQIADSSIFTGAFFAAPSINEDSGAVAFRGRFSDQPNGLFVGNGHETALDDYLVIARNQPGLDVSRPGAFVGAHVAFSGIAGPRPGFFRGNGASPHETMILGGDSANGSVAPAMNASGRTAFRGFLSPPKVGDLIATAAGGTRDILYESGGDGNPDFLGFFGVPDINDAGQVLFHGSIRDGAEALFRGTGGALTTIARVVPSEFSIREAPFALNENGQAAFVALRGGADNGRFGVFSGNGGALTTVAESSAGGFQGFNAVAINDAGSVAFRGFLPGGRSGIFTGDDLLADKVIAIGDNLFGSTVTNVDFQRYGWNNREQAVFEARLSDGRAVIARADPELQWANAADGLFQTAGNWDPRVVPGDGDNAAFVQPGRYTVQLTEDVTHNRLRANGAGVNVTLDLNGHDYTLNEINIGGRDGDNVSITFADTGGPVVAAAGDGSPLADPAGDLRAQIFNALKGGLANIDTSISTRTGLIHNGGRINVKGGNGFWEVGLLRLRAGTLEVSNRGTLSSTRAELGDEAGAPISTATVAGVDTVWDNRVLVVGEKGSGRLNINNKGLVRGRDIVIASEAGSQGTISLSDASLTQNSGEILTVGSKGQGTLEIVDDGVVVAGQLIVGRLNGGSGVVTVSGRSSLRISDALSIGAAGNGNVNVSNGNVEALQLSVGDSGTGTLAVSGGGKVLVHQAAVIGQNTGGMGTVTIDGQGSKFEYQTLLVGESGRGTLKILNNATMSGSNNIVLGSDTGSSGLLEVSGASLRTTGSLDNLDVGHSGAGVLEVKNGAVVETSSLRVASSSVVSGSTLGSGTGSVNVESLAQLKVNGSLRVGEHGMGRLTIDAGSVEQINSLSSTLIGPSGAVDTTRGVVEVLRGHFHERNALTVNGTLAINATLGSASVGQNVQSPGRVSIGPGGTLRGNGLIRGRVNVLPGGVNQFGGTLLPGTSPGTLTIDGDYEQTGGLLGIEVAGTGAGQFDVLKVTGNATIGGEVSLEFLDGFAPRQGDVFKFLDIGGTLGGQFADVELRNLAPEFQFDLRRDGGSMTMVALNDGVFVPPPPSVWNMDAAGNWSSAANWTVDVPDNAGDTATFGSKITAPRTVTVDVPITVGRLDFDSAHAYTITGDETVTLNTRSSHEQINVISGTHTISAPVTLADNTTVTVSPAAGNLSITGALGASGVTLTKAGAGTLTLNNLRAAGLSINGGIVAIAPNGTATGTSTIGTLSIAGATDAWTAKLDLANNNVVVQSTAANKAVDFNRLYNQLKHGFNNGAWNGPGITSATAANNANTDTGLAVLDNALLGYTNFSGQPATADSILLKYTFYGDIDANGAVDADDLTVFANNFGRTAGATQIDGDIDFNGTVDADDLTVFANNFNKGIGNPLNFGNVQAVPEPQTIALLVIGLAALLMAARTNRRATPSPVARTP